MGSKANIVIDQGATYSTTIDVTDDNGTPIDLTGYSAEAQIRKHYTSVNAIEFDINVGGLTGIITISLSANATANLAAGRYVYDCELTSDEGVVSRIVEGIVTVTPNVTR